TWRERAAALAGRVIDFTHFVHDLAKLPPGSLAGGPPLRVTYHDSCQSHNCLKLRPEGRAIVTDVLGLELVEMAESSFCCGFGGSFSFEFPEVSRRILARKLAHADETGAEVIVTDNPGCIMQIRGGLDAAGKPLRMLHLAELVAERLESGSAGPG